MDPTASERTAARAILNVARGICDVEFPTSRAESPSKKVLVVLNSAAGSGIQWRPVVFDGELWAIIARGLPHLSALPFTRDVERDLLPEAVRLLREAVEEWGTPTLEDSPEYPAGQRTPGWAAKNDPFDP